MHRFPCEDWRSLYSIHAHSPFCIHGNPTSGHRQATHFCLVSSCRGSRSLEDPTGPALVCLATRIGQGIELTKDGKGKYTERSIHSATGKQIFTVQAKLYQSYYLLCYCISWQAYSHIASKNPSWTPLENLCWSCFQLGIQTISASAAFCCASRWALWPLFLFASLRQALKTNVS